MEHAPSSELVSFPYAEVVFKGQLYRPAGAGPHPGVLVVPTARGIGGHVLPIAERLAGEGYVALVVDLYGDGAYSRDDAVIGTLVGSLWGNAPALRSRMQAWLDVLRRDASVAPDRIAALGYCFGGQCVLEMARAGCDVRAVVSFHGILSTNLPAEPGAIRAKVAVHTGGLDPHAPRAAVEALRAELTAAGADWHIAEYGGAYHGFTDPEANSPDTGRAYHPLADRLSWSSTLGLLAAVLRPGS